MERKRKNRFRGRRTFLISLIMILAIIAMLSGIVPYVMNIVTDTSDNTYMAEARSIYLAIDEKISENQGAIPNVTQIDEFNDGVRKKTLIESVGVSFNDGPTNVSSKYDYYVVWKSANNKQVQAGISKTGNVTILSSK